MPKAYADLPVAVTKRGNIDLFKDAALFSVTFHMWGNRRKANALPVDRILNGQAKERIRSTMTLVKSDAYDAIKDYIVAARAWFLARSMPSFTDGVFFVKLSEVQAFEEKVAEVQAELADRLVPALLADYERVKDAARFDYADIARDLGIPNLYNERDYPTPDRLAGMFGIDHSWLAFTVPDNLPDDVRAREEVKIRAKFEEATEEITYALREMFAALVDHAAERLTPSPDGKSKIFRDTLIENFREFFETFNARNLTDDQQLETLVTRARELMSGVDPDNLRRSPYARQKVAGALGQLKAGVDRLLVDKPGRKFDFGDE